MPTGSSQAGRYRKASGQSSKASSRARKISGRSRIPTAKNLRSNDGESEELECPVWDYQPHLVSRGMVMNPHKIKPFTRELNDFSFWEDKGLPALGIRLREGILFAVNHAQPDVCDTVIFPNRDLAATISGGKVEDCAQLLRDLKEQCDAVMPEHMDFKMLLQLMTQTLSCRLEVGLVAGWDSASDGPALYRVDGMGGYIRGEILATGSGFRLLYSSMNIEFQISSKISFPDRKFELAEVLDRPSEYEKYWNWSAWSPHEAAKWAIRNICWTAANAEHGFDYVTMYFLGRGTVTTLFPGKPVEEFVKNCVMPARRFKGLWNDPHRKRK
ncbi:OLC1v1037780C3 [Oldenlandia corymbosa var. corymbosa]|uniref:OLC1v1037780C3 n=1 Tax=Oldenlandia corymbosa var. corymbosa TaxID=529605 RepID=A0AAV1CYT8_OLDCO|nr:OLC1v1037780C3 [Oldenlandia corymbosa var. corymbosa]